MGVAFYFTHRFLTNVSVSSPFFELAYHVRRKLIGKQGSSSEEGKATLEKTDSSTDEAKAESHFPSEGIRMTRMVWTRLPLLRVGKEVRLTGWDGSGRGGWRGWRPLVSVRRWGRWWQETFCCRVGVPGGIWGSACVLWERLPGWKGQYQKLKKRGKIVGPANDFKQTERVWKVQEQVWDPGHGVDMVWWRRPVKGTFVSVFIVFKLFLCLRPHTFQDPRCPSIDMIYFLFQSSSPFQVNNSFQVYNSGSAAMYPGQKWLGNPANWENTNNHSATRWRSPPNIWTLLTSCR